MNTDKPTVEEGNRIIAEFMGDNYTNRQIPRWAFRETDFDVVTYGAYQYHTSWDWLMPVVKKIASSIRGSKHKNAIIFSLEKVEIKETWITVIEFIQWYNQNKQP